MRASAIHLSGSCFLEYGDTRDERNDDAIEIDLYLDASPAKEAERDRCWSQSSGLSVKSTFCKILLTLLRSNLDTQDMLTFTKVLSPISHECHL